jgi:SAM-dependent methyltransferase
MKHKKQSYSILRGHQYDRLKTVDLDGNILDLGGSRKSGYHELIGGKHVFSVVNFGDTHPGMDLNFDLEKKFPLADSSFDHAVAMNVLEHIFDYHNVFAETARVLKVGGQFVLAVPFMHHIHGSPDDYHRYTASTYRKLADRYGFEIIRLEPLGFGFFSLVHQTVGWKLPTNVLRQLCKKTSIGLDKVLSCFAAYRRLSSNIPLGYFILLNKKQ